jgi:hypothetical protein
MNIFGNGGGYGSMQGMSQEQYEAWLDRRRPDMRNTYPKAILHDCVHRESSTDGELYTHAQMKKVQSLLEQAKLLDKEQQAQIKRLKGWVRFLAVWVLVIILIHTAAFIWWLA